MTTLPRTNNSQTSPLAKAEKWLNARKNDYRVNPPIHGKFRTPQDHKGKKLPGSMKT